MKDVAIPVVFPDYRITVETPAVSIDVPDFLPAVPDRIMVRGMRRSLPYLGHAGILFFDGGNGVTKYFEYGRYDVQALGIVRQQGLPDVRIQFGRPTAASLRTCLAAVSRRSGAGGRISGAYLELPAGAFGKMLVTAKSRQAQNTDTKRTSYDLTANSCLHFMKEVAEAGGARMPPVGDPRPVGYIDRVRDIHADLDFRLPSSLAIKAVALP